MPGIDKLNEPRHYERLTNALLTEAERALQQQIPHTVKSWTPSHACGAAEGDQDHRAGQEPWCEHDVMASSMTVVQGRFLTCEGQNEPCELDAKMHRFSVGLSAWTPSASLFLAPGGRRRIWAVEAPE